MCRGSGPAWFRCCAHGKQFLHSWPLVGGILSTLEVVGVAIPSSVVLCRRVPGMASEHRKQLRAGAAARSDVEMLYAH